jgi:PAS domain S-box-containing protein
MAMVRPGTPLPAAEPRWRQFVDLLRSFPGQARLALGVDGVAWATMAGIVGLICCAVSFTQVALSLHATEVEHRQQSAVEILALDQATRKLLRTVHLMSYGERQPAEVQVPLRSAWPQFQSALATVCGRQGNAAPQADRMGSACATGSAMRDILAPEIEAFDPPNRLINPSEIGKVIALVGDFNSLSAVVARDANALVDRMVDNYDWALFVLTLSTAGFAGAGLVLILLVGRASMRHFEQSQQATRAAREAGEARDLLQETIDALPAGVVLYDQQERLVMFNAAALAASPLLKRPDIIGITYEELARETGKLSEEFGAPLINTPDEWIERFRSKGARRMRQSVEGRWFEWSEKLTASGRTVGLRVDVTDLKTRELEIERTRDLLQETIDSLPAGVVVYDKDERLVMFNKVAASVSPCLAQPGAVGKTYAELAYDDARLNEAAGIHFGELPEQWIARFHSKGTRHRRQIPDGRWIEWQEKDTQSGGTVGLRVDITDLKTRELEIERARDLLQETIDALPAGVVLYDKDERLVMYNKAAASMAPGLTSPGAVGKTYPELVYEAVHQNQVGGIAASESPERWIERFRSKSERHLRQAPGGRWVEWSEKGTQNGGTVGLRVDVTELKTRELELERARADYQSLVDSMSDMVYALDPKGVFTFASASCAELLGIPAAQLIGVRFADFVVPEDMDRANAAARAHLPSSDNGVRQIQLRMKRADGVVRHFEFRYRRPPLRDNRNDAAIGVMRDISERVELTRQLEKHAAEVEHARADYQALVDSLSDMVHTVDPRTNIVTFASAASAEVLGRPPSQVIGTSAFDHIVAEDLEYVVAETQAALADTQGRVRQFQYRARTASGAERHVEVRARRMRDADRRTVIAGVMHDVEERVQLQRKLDAEMARLRSIVESSGAMIVLVDRALGVVMVNSEFTAVTGLAGEDTVGRSLKQVVDWPLDAAALDAWLSDAPDRERAKPERFATWMRDQQGRQRLIAVTATPVADEHDRVNSIVFLGVDDTERRETEEALFDAERLATVGEMAATVAHEIAQPLQVINIACSSVHEELAEATARGGAPDQEFLTKKIDRIDAQVDRAGRIIGELRAFVRGTSQEMPGRFEPAVAVRGAVDLTQHAARTAGIALSVSMPDALPGVMGHVGKLEQVLVNLINNACDAGSQVIEVSAAALRRDGRRFVRISVEDDGPGISAGVLPRLFESFVTTKLRGKGTGLGLRICRRIVEEMGGSISAANRTGQRGACFEILLPVAPAASEPAADQF